jgi:hypothetical protein
MVGVRVRRKQSCGSANIPSTALTATLTTIGTDAVAADDDFTVPNAAAITATAGDAAAATAGNFDNPFFVLGRASFNQQAQHGM